MSKKTTYPGLRRFDFKGAPVSPHIGKMNTGYRYMWNFKEQPTSGKMGFISKTGQ